MRAKIPLAALLRLVNRGNKPVAGMSDNVASRSAIEFILMFPLGLANKS